MTITGNAGINFNITETETTDTGEVTQEHDTAATLSALTLASTDVVYTISGTVGTTAFDFDLNAIDNASGTGYDMNVVRNQEGDMTTIKMVAIHNTHATGTISVGSPAATSFLTWNSNSDDFDIEAGACVAFAYTTAKTIGTDGKINLVADTASTSFEIYVLGT